MPTTKITLSMSLLWLGGILTMAQGQQTKRWSYPEAPARPVTDVYHGVEIVDPYRWLEDVNDPAVRTWALADEATRSILDKDPGRLALVETLKKLHDYQTTSAPTVRGERFFFTRREGLKNQPVVYVREGRPDAEPRVLLDPNTFSPDGTVALDWMFPSPDGSLLAYGASPNGSEMSTLKILEVATGRPLPDSISRTRACTVAWEPSGKAFWYVRYPAKGTVPAGDEMYNRKIFRHELGSDAEQDPMVFGEGRPKIDWLGVSESEDGRYAIISSSTDWIKNDLFLKKFGDDSPPVPLAVGLDGQVDTFIFDGRVVIHTNAKTPRYRVAITDVDHLDPKDWKEIIPEPSGTAVIERVRVVDRKLAVLTSDLAVASLALYDLDGRCCARSRCPRWERISRDWRGRVGQERAVLFVPVFPQSADRITARHPGRRAGRQRSLDRRGRPGRSYEVKQVRYLSKDGTSVPMFVISRKGLKTDGNAPTLLYGYGGFNIKMTPTYKSDLRVWLDRGGVYAIANLRGGGEIGREWHAAGRLGRKQNVFDDFIAAAEYLRKAGVTGPSRLAIEGGSNGGLLVSACMTQRPELYRAVICAVPLCDMLRFHRFSIARNWVPEYGSSDDPAAFAWLRAYSPYHHVKPNEAYPAVLLLTGESDTRVEPMHAFKMAARLQAASSSEHPVLLRVEPKAGHGAGKPLAKRIEEEADKWTFLFEQLSVH